MKKTLVEKCPKFGAKIKAMTLQEQKEEKTNKSYLS